MFQIELDVLVDPDIEVHSLGHITMMGPGGIITSKNKSPDQAMMIFLTLADFLDGAASLLTKKNPSEYHLEAIDSSFCLVIRKYKNKRQANLISVIYDNTEITTVLISDFVSIITKEVDRFLAQYDSFISHDPLMDDLKGALDRFRKLGG